MELYHIDRSNSLRKGVILKVDEQGLSEHGRRYWREVPVKSGADFGRVIIEHIFEEVRLLEFPHMQSRFASLFACNADDLDAWLSMFGDDSVVWKIETPKAVRLDSALLMAFWKYPDGEWFDPYFARICARLYWKGESITSLRDSRCPAPFPYKIPPRWEHLAALPARVVRRS